MRCPRCGRKAESRWGKVIVLSLSRETKKVTSDGQVIMEVPTADAEIIECTALGDGCSYNRAGDWFGDAWIADDDLIPLGRLMEWWLTQDNGEDDQKRQPRRDPGE